VGGFAPDAFDLTNGLVDLAVRVVGEGRVVEPEVERGLAAVRGD
jgi:hypothetical protein